jgi:hypothetical protein
MILVIIMFRMYKAVTVLSALITVCTIAFYDKRSLYCYVGLQSCTDPLQVLPGSSCETFPSSSDGTCDVGNMKFEEDIDIKEEEKVNVKAEKGIVRKRSA